MTRLPLPDPELLRSAPECAALAALDLALALADTALRLARVVGMSPDFWLGLQQDWDLWHAMRGERAAEINRLMPLAG